MAAPPCPATAAIGPGGWQGTKFNGCATPVVDDTGKPPVYDLILTWYGVQTDGPQSSGVVTSDMYRTNALQIIQYMVNSPLNYTGICLHVDSPVGNSCANQGKPANFVGDVDMMVALIDAIPPQYRVGFHVVVEQDATWQVNSSQPCPGHYQYKPTTFASINPECVGVTPESEAARCGAEGTVTVNTQGCCYYRSDKCWPIVQPGGPNTADPACDGTNPPTDNNSPCFVYHSGPGTANGVPIAGLTYEPGCCWAFNGAHGAANPDCPNATFTDPSTYKLTTWGSTNTVCAGPFPADPSVSPCPDLTSSLSSSCCTYLQYAQCAAVLGPAAYSPGTTYAYGPSPAGECTQGASIRSATAFPPGFDISSQAVWYGGAGAAGAASAVTSSGYPYQVAAVAAYNGEAACPYKAVAAQGDDDPADISMPPGCPNNLGKVGWYCALINAKLRAMNSRQIVSMMNWDAEGNGPDGLQCSIFQFLYGLRQYGTAEDAQPQIYVPGKQTYVPVPWVLYQNGSSGMAASADAPSDTIPCGHWAAVDINLIGDAVDASTGVTTYGDMAVFQAAPEYYWFAGDDMGGVADGGKPGEGMLQSLVDAGYFGCPQSGVGKAGYDTNCGCRNTVYETYGHLTDGGIALVDLLCELYGQTAANIPGSTPAFSIEHLGGWDNPINFSTCINAQNFCKTLDSDSSTMTLCGANSKCTPRCGVANFFGGWTEECFKQFLDYFAVKYGAKSLMVYDAGFIPTAWVTGQIPAIATTPSIDGCAPQVAPTSSAFIASQWSQYGVSVTDPCPLTLADATRYMCGDSYSSTTGGYKVSTAPGVGLIIPQNLRCFTCSDVARTCAFLPGDAGTSSHNFQLQKVCEDSLACATVPPTWPTAAGPVVPIPPASAPGPYSPVVPIPPASAPGPYSPVVPIPPASAPGPYSPVVPGPYSPVVPIPPASAPGPYSPVVPIPPASAPGPYSPVVPIPPASGPSGSPGPVVPPVYPVKPVVPVPPAAGPGAASVPAWVIAVSVIAGLVVIGVVTFLILKYAVKLPQLSA
jgi:hypothetical protein